MRVSGSAQRGTTARQGEEERTHLPPLGDLLDFLDPPPLAHPELDALALQPIPEGLGQALDAALDAPHARALHRLDELPSLAAARPDPLLDPAHFALVLVGARPPRARLLPPLAAREPAEQARDDNAPPLALGVPQLREDGAHAQPARVARVYAVDHGAEHVVGEGAAEPARKEAVDRLVGGVRVLCGVEGRARAEGLEEERGEDAADEGRRVDGLEGREERRGEEGEGRRGVEVPVAGRGGRFGDDDERRVESEA